MKKSFFLVGVFLISLFVISSVNADLFVRHEQIKSEGAPGDILEYNITILNKGSSERYIYLNFMFASPDFSKNAFTLTSNEEITVNLLFSVPRDSKPGMTYQPILFFDKEGKDYNLNVLLPVKILAASDAPSRFSSVVLSELKTEPEIADPREPFIVKFTADNPVEKATVVFTLRSDALNFQETFTLKKGLNEYSVPITLDADTESGNYPATVSLDFWDHTITRNLTFAVQGYSTCNVSTETTSSIFGRSFRANIKNYGNSATECFVSDRISLIEKGLISEVSQGYVFENGMISWSTNIEPQSSAVISYSINYVPILAIPFVIILLAFGYWYFTRKMEIKKELVDYKRYPGYMDLKIQLRVKNLTNKEFDKIKIKDPLPSFAKEIRDYGTVPGKIVKKGSVKHIIWDISNLKPYEERVFSYKFRTSLEVLGKINFPQTQVEFKDNKGETITNSSNILVVEVE